MHLAAKAPRLRGPLSSNVRQHTEAMLALSIAAGAAVAAKDQMHSLASSMQVRNRLSGIAQAPQSAHLRSKVRSQRFAATDLCFSIRWFQSVLGAAATRKALRSFTAGSGGGMNNSCASPPLWHISGQ